MLSVKIWTLILTAVSAIMNRDYAPLENGNGAMIEKDAHVGGYIGCLEANVCLLSEICVNDGLFGKCVFIDSEFFVYPRLSTNDVILIKDVANTFKWFSVTWDDQYLQCVLRSLIFKLRLDYNEINILAICGRFSYNSELISPLSSLAPLPWDRKNVLNELRRFLLTGAGMNSKVSNPLQVKQKFRRSLTAEKKFNRDKLVEMSTTELERITKKLVWLQFNKPRNYINAREFLDILSAELGIRPPIAQFQLDRSGRFLQFQVPFESQMTGTDVITLLGTMPLWLKKYNIENVGIGIPELDSSNAADKNFPVVDALTEDDVRKPAESSELLSRAGLFGLVAASTSAFVVGFIFFARWMCHKRAPPADENRLMESPSISTAEPVKQKLVSFSPTNSPFLSRATGANVHESKLINEVFRQSRHSAGGSEASTESMAHTPVTRTAHLSSNSSWSEETAQPQLDVTTGHLILTYMEEHLQSGAKLEADWEAITSYVSEEAVPCEAARKPENVNKNRRNCPIPYEQTRVLLSNRDNDYINASLIYDSDPRTPAYIAATTPLPGTVADFWQMVWEKFVVVIVCLETEASLCQPATTINQENDTTTQTQYWPSTGFATFGPFEIRLVSEHIQSGTYIIRSFYLRQIETGETRTVTQFHFSSWADEIPSSHVRSLLDFRRKVNKSFRAKNSPIVVHCVDGSGKTGTYILLDLVLNRIGRGIKELDVAASLEYLRDQREEMIRTRKQYELVIGGIAEEVVSILNTAS